AGRARVRHLQPAARRPHHLPRYRDRRRRRERRHRSTHPPGVPQPGPRGVIYLNSPGGSYTSLMAIYDTMTFISSPISTFCVGQAASTAAILLAGGDSGRRFILEHARVLLGQPASGGQRGVVSDLRLQAKEMVRIRDQVEEVLATHTGHDVAARRADRDKVFTATEAVAYGLADKVVPDRFRAGWTVRRMAGSGQAVWPVVRKLSKPGSGGEAQLGGSRRGLGGRAVACASPADAGDPGQAGQPAVAERQQAGQIEAEGAGGGGEDLRGRLLAASLDLGEVRHR